MRIEDLYTINTVDPLDKVLLEKALNLLNKFYLNDCSVLDKIEIRQLFGEIYKLDTFEVNKQLLERKWILEK